MIQDRISGRQAGDSGSNIWQAGGWCRWISHRISDRQVDGAEISHQISAFINHLPTSSACLHHEAMSDEMLHILR